MKLRESLYDTVFIYMSESLTPGVGNFHVTRTIIFRFLSYSSSKTTVVRAWLSGEGAAFEIESSRVQVPPGPQAGFFSSSLWFNSSAAFVHS